MKVLPHQLIITAIIQKVLEAVVLSLPVSLNIMLRVWILKLSVLALQTPFIKGLCNANAKHFAANVDKDIFFPSPSNSLPNKNADYF